MECRNALVRSARLREIVGNASRIFSPNPRGATAAGRFNHSVRAAPPRGQTVCTAGGGRRFARLLHLARTSQTAAKAAGPADLLGGASAPASAVGRRFEADENPLAAGVLRGGLPHHRWSPAPRHYHARRTARVACDRAECGTGARVRPHRVGADPSAATQPRL